MDEFYSTMKRKLYTRVTADDGKAKSHKVALCRERGISARMFNAMAIELQGSIDDTRELFKKKRRGVRAGIRRLKRLLAHGMRNSKNRQPTVYT
jgi:hypothetical protein